MNRLMDALKKKGWTAEDLAAHLCRSTRTVRHLASEAGASNPLAFVRHLSSDLGVSADFLVGMAGSSVPAREIYYLDRAAFIGQARARGCGDAVGRMMAARVVDIVTTNLSLLGFEVEILLVELPEINRGPHTPVVHSLVSSASTKVWEGHWDA